MRLKFYFSYDGTSYSGWQRQKNVSNTIQEIFETKLSMVLNSRIRLTASGRTDAGVHARIQVAHADVPDHSRMVKNGQLNSLMQSLNSLLPHEIRILRIEQVDTDFHANRDVVKKTYVYFINPAPVQWPELRQYSWHLRFPLDWAAIEKATQALIGTHDFKAFQGADSSVKTTVRTLFEARWGEVRWQGFSGDHKLMALRLTGSGFLRNMVRSIAGTLVHIGNARAQPELVSELLNTQDRTQVGPTAPARGLWLWDILYLT